jgi:hypothetical protein
MIENIKSITGKEAVHMKRSMILLIGIGLFLQTACSDRDLQKISQSMVALATAVGELQKDVIAANEQKLLSDHATGEILQICLKINAAGKQIDAVLRSVRQLDADLRKNLLALLTLISQALDPSQLEFIAGNEDPAMKQKIDAAFILVRTTLASLQIVMASSGG